ncbi:MAG: ABC transporter ATP-binding protein [Chloroflexota bacterium]
MLHVQSLTKTFFPGTVDEVVALRDLNLVVQPGEFVTLIGSNGAGKSTLLNAIAGVFRCDSGRIRLNDVDITTQPEHRRAASIARVYQDPKLGTAPTMSIEEHLAMALLRGEPRGLARGVSKPLRERFREELKPLGIGLEDRLSASVGTLSGGQRQSLALVMAAIKKPALLLLDEHTASLDPKTAVRIMELTDRVIRAHGLTAVMVTHNMEHALRHGGRLVMMHQGRTVLDVSGEDKRRYTVLDLVAAFERQAGERFVDDTALLA